MTRIHAISLAAAVAVAGWVTWQSVQGPSAADGLELPVSATHGAIHRPVPLEDGVEVGEDSPMAPVFPRVDAGGEPTKGQPVDEDRGPTSGAGRPAPLAFSTRALERSAGDENRATTIGAPRQADDGADVAGPTGPRHRRGGGGASVGEGVATSGADLREPFSAFLLVVPYALGDPEHTATIPAVLADVPPRSVSAQPTIATEVSRVESDFLNHIAGGSDDPLDPEFQRQWLEAQEASDARLKASLGGHAWLDRHREVHRQAREGVSEVGGR